MLIIHVAPGQGAKYGYLFVSLHHKGKLQFSLESPHRGDSNEHTQYSIFNMKKKNTLIYPKSVPMGFFSKGLKSEFETAVVSEPSVNEPLKFSCINNLRKKNTSPRLLYGKIFGKQFIACLLFMIQILMSEANCLYAFLIGLKKYDHDTVCY